jgi:hypothetical protein
MPTETRIKASALKAIGLLAGSAGLSAVGYYFLFNSGATLEDAGLVLLGLFSDPGPAIIAILLFGCLLAFPIYLIGLVFAGAGGKGPCPVCAGEISTLFASESNLLCTNCNTYLRCRRGTLSVMSDAEISPEPSFGAPTEWEDVVGLYGASAAGDAYDLVTTKNTGGRVLSATWPDGCCVCGEPARFAETIRAEATLVPLTAIHLRTRKATLVAAGIPHCEKHKGGVKFGPAPVATPPKTHDMYGLLFRSLAYRNKFCRANPWKWKRHY